MAAELRARISADATPYLGALGAVRRATLGMSGAMSSIGGALGIGFSVAGIAAAIKGVANFGDEISDASKKTGIGVEALQSLRFIGKLSGMEFSALQIAVKSMSKGMYEAQTAGGAAGQAFSALGLKTKDLAGMSIDDQFLAIVGALGKVADQNKKAALAMKIFGKSGTDVLPMVADGVDSIRAARDRFRSSGGILSAKDIETAAQFNDQIDALGMTLQGEFQNSILSTFPQMIEYLEKNQEAIDNIGFAFDGLAMVMRGVLAVFEALGSIGTGSIETAFKAAEIFANKMKDFQAMFRILMPGGGGEVTAKTIAEERKRMGKGDGLLGALSASAEANGTTSLSAKELLMTGAGPVIAILDKILNRLPEKP
jgi:hypothetical protein